MKKVFLLLCFIGWTTMLIGQIKVGFVGMPRQAGPDIEFKHCLAALSEYGDITLTPISPETIIKRPSTIETFDVLWIQRNDTAPLSLVETDLRLLKKLKLYLENGGRLLLNQESFRYLNLLGIEPEIPETRMKPCIDEGYGRKLGIHAFRDHPLFAGLNGGAYLQRPTRDTTLRVTGYFGEHQPVNGKVIAVDWDYIFLREASKMVIEYEVGKGKVIAVGGYMNYSMQNLNFAHLGLFTANTIRYLAGVQPATPENYWYYGPYTVLPCPQKLQDLDRPFAAIPAGHFWSLPKEAIAFGSRPATVNPWDVAGERMVIMGTEKSGIEEIWTHPFMALRDFETGIREADSTHWLASFKAEVVISPSFIARTYKLAGGVLKEVIVASPDEPNGVVHYENTGEMDLLLTIRFKSNLRFMWPYSEWTTGTICHGWDADYNAFTAMDRTGDLVLIAGANQPPEAYSSGQDRQEFRMAATATYRIPSGGTLDFVITGTSEGQGAALGSFDRAIRDPEAMLTAALKHTESVFEHALVITTPNDTFNKGYLWALSGTDKFFVNTPGMGSSLVAGYSTTRTGWDGEHKVNGRPGYGWYFGRDGEWSGMALLDYGDFEKVRELLSFYEKYQDLSGKIFHEATTSGVIHYDASDATPLYIVLAGRYFRYSNDTTYLRKSWHHIKKAISFCSSTDTDGDHLIENTNVGHGWVEGGELYGSHATLYLNACWASALEEAGRMAGFMKDPDREHFLAEHNEIMNIINRDFWRASPALGGPARDFGYYSYGKNKDGSFRTEITMLPAVSIYFGLTESAKARAMLDRYASNTFSTNWGVRIIGDDSPLFKPTGYHYGSVWPLFTGWTALAEYKAGNYPSGFTHIMNNLNVYRNWSLGFVEEVLNGAVYKPSGVCPHQCWSETMVLQPAIEGLLGLNVDAGEKRLTLAPRLPVNWDSLHVSNIRAGNARLNFDFLRRNTRCDFTFVLPVGQDLECDFMPAFPAGTSFNKVSLNGQNIPFTTFSGNGHETVVCHFPVRGTTSLVIETNRGIGILPVIADPSPGDSAAGPRVISERMAGNTYMVDVEGPAGTTGDFRVRMLNSTFITKLVNSDIFTAGPETYLLKVNFKPGEQKYVRRTVILETPK